jgi:FkbM family methyltransferase
MNHSHASIVFKAIAKVRSDGAWTVLARRLRWYRERFNGTLVGLRGNKVHMDGMTYSVEPFSSTLKSTLARGRHEQPERDLVRRWLPPDIPLVEFGGGMGAVSCLANRKLSDPTRHVVVEANPAMVPLLSTNRDLNGCRFTILNCALGYDRDTIPLDLDPDFVGSSAVGSVGNSTITVKTTTVARIMSDHAFQECGIVCDIEGAEADLIEREFPELGERVRYIMAEFHPHIIGHDATERLFGSLSSMGFLHKQTIGNCGFYSRP